MATKKDFSELDTMRVYDAITAATEKEEEEKPKRRPRKEYTAEERLKFIEEMRTSGRKGVKMPRINVAFSPDVYEYIKIMSKVRGETLTAFINIALKTFMEEHRDLYDKVLEVRDSL